MIDRPESLLSVRDLSVEFLTNRGWIRAVDGLSFDIRSGETLGLVGESGSGKSVTALSILRLIPTPPGRIAEGTVLFEGADLLKLGQAEIRRIRGRDIAMVFQEPMTSLNPAYTVGEQVAESVRRHWGYDRRTAWRRAIEVLDLVRIPDAKRRVSEYPHTFSGGMRQRVVIAIAIACNPKLLLADEPTTALDVTVQAEILDLLRELQTELGMAILLVTHDLGVVAEMSERVMVMYAGKLMEDAAADELFDKPLHPYTEGLMRSMPMMGTAGKALESISGRVPSPWSMPQGCRFHPRCKYAEEPVCTTADIPMTVADGRAVRCVRASQLELLGSGQSSG